MMVLRIFERVTFLSLIDMLNMIDEYIHVKFLKPFPITWSNNLMLHFDANITKLCKSTTNFSH